MNFRWKKFKVKVGTCFFQQAVFPRKHMKEKVHDILRKQHTRLTPLERLSQRNAIEKEFRQVTW